MSTVQEMTSDTFNRPEYGADDFQYRPMPPLVPISLAFVFLSMLAGLQGAILLIAS